MASNDSLREQPLASPGELYAEAVEFLARHTTVRDNKEGRKAKQLCRQVAETLDLVLSGDCSDERLQALHVMAVVPAPNTSRLLVTVAADLPADAFDRRQIEELLDRQADRLRTEVAASIHRKRAPALAFRVMGPLSPPT